MICNICGVQRYMTIPNQPCPAPACEGMLVDGPPPPTPPVAVPVLVPVPVPVPRAMPAAEPPAAGMVKEEKVIRIARTSEVTRATIKIDKSLQPVWDRILQRAQAFDTLGATGSGDLIRKLLHDLVTEFGV